MVQDYLDPTTVFFLGDLFDGGREWMPSGTANADPRWRRYGEDFWAKEYKRFGNVFFNEWVRRGVEGQHTDIHRKIMAGLPGNHDLGLGNGIRLPVRKRFNAYLGAGNQIDVIGNHTFVSLDTVSLSAKGQPDPATGRQGAVDGNGSNREIWAPVDEFLTTIQDEKRRAIDRAVRFQNNRIENNLLFHAVLDLQDPLISKSVHTAFTPKADMPVVLLTHVPLYRAAGTPCGPLRERSPPSTTPSAGGEYLETDPGNAIKVEAGIQYQNVLTPEISNEIIEKVGEVEFAFSGDDHDYCEVVHRRYTSPRGGVREITVKAFSWAMGVRRPGFLLVSLWNPLDRGTHHADKEGKDEVHRTVQTHLCLLPDQLAIFVRYGVLFGLTFMGLLVHAVRKTNRNNENIYGANGSILPLSSFEKIKKSDSPPPSPTHRKNIHIHTPTNGLSARNVTRDTKQGTYSLLHDEVLDERWGEVSLKRDDGYAGDGRERRRGLRREFWGLLWRVGVVVGGWYFWCVRKY
ncbi:MAG: hypothetical protein Q9170_007083 [Blastenia crenularia]